MTCCQPPITRRRTAKPASVTCAATASARDSVRNDATTISNDEPPALRAAGSEAAAVGSGGALAGGGAIGAGTARRCNGGRGGRRLGGGRSRRWLTSGRRRARIRVNRRRGPKHEPGHSRCQGHDPDQSGHGLRARSARRGQLQRYRNRLRTAIEVWPHRGVWRAVTTAMAATEAAEVRKARAPRETSLAEDDRSPPSQSGRRRSCAAAGDTRFRGPDRTAG